MTKTVKNSLIIFTMVCAIAFVAFTIELIVINRNGGNSGSSLSDSEPATTEETNDRNQTLSTGDGASSGIVDNTPDESTLRPAGTAYDMQISGGKTLTWHADEELFRYTHTETGVIFTYTDMGNASFEICLVELPYGADARAETFLEEYLDGNESNVGGMALIRRSPLSGVFVSGVNDGETFETWIYAIEDDVYGMGIAFVIRYRNDEQKNALYAILDTVDVVDS